MNVPWPAIPGVRIVHFSKVWEPVYNTLSKVTWKTVNGGFSVLMGPKFSPAPCQLYNQMHTLWWLRRDSGSCIWVCEASVLLLLCFVLCTLLSQSELNQQCIVSLTGNLNLKLTIAVLQLASALPVKIISRSGYH